MDVLKVNSELLQDWWRGGPLKRLASVRKGTDVSKEIEIEREREEGREGGKERGREVSVHVLWLVVDMATKVTIRLFSITIKL